MSASRLLLNLDRLAIGSVMLLPLLLMHAHGVAEVAIGLADLCLLLGSAVSGSWGWLRTPWLWVAGAWWAWLVLCSLPVAGTDLGEGGKASFIQALATVRFLLLVVAMEFVVLRTAEARRWMYRLIAASAAWIVLNSIVQNITGRNLIGWPPASEGVLTGPFAAPRAGPPMARIIIPAVLPPVAALLAKPGTRSTVVAYALLAGSVVMMVLIGQRMPLVLTVMGLAVVALLIGRLRPVVLATAIAGALVLAASPVVAPSAYYRLVEKFTSQMQHFSVSPYGQLYARAWEVGRLNPISGMGFNGFGTGCRQPAYFRPTFDGSQSDGGGAAICWVHPHNHYLQALDDGGFIGLGLFVAAGVAWLLPLGRGLWREPEPLRVGLFAAIFIQLWPIQSTSAFTSMPMGGWFFLLLGWAMAEARGRSRSVAEAPVGRALRPANQVVINPLGNQTTRFVDRCLRVMDAVKRCTGLERRHIVGPDLAEFAVCGNHGSFAPAGNLTFLRHFRALLLRIIRMLPSAYSVSFRTASATRRGSVQQRTHLRLCEKFANSRSV